jgi:hypothetical protein
MSKDWGSKIFQNSFTIWSNLFGRWINDCGPIEEMQWIQNSRNVCPHLVADWTWNQKIDSSCNGNYAKSVSHRNSDRCPERERLYVISYSGIIWNR